MKNGAKLRLAFTISLFGCATPKPEARTCVLSAKGDAFLCQKGESTVTQETFLVMDARARGLICFDAETMEQLLKCRSDQRERSAK